MNSEIGKVCIIGPGLKMGGVERATANLANGLNKLSISVTYIALFRLDFFFKLDHGISFFEPPNFNKKKLSFFKTILWIRKRIRHEAPKVIIVYSIFYAALVSFALIGTTYSIFLSERSSPFYKWPWHIRIFCRLVFWIKKPIGVIAQTSIAAKQQQFYYGKKIPIKVIPNSVREVTLFSDVKRENIVLAVGRFNDTLKGFDRLIEAFSLIKNNNWKLVFAGGDEDGIQLKDLAKKLNIHERVTFLGKVKEIDKVYAKAGIFVMPSRSEGFPNALCEAMAAGIPCISFDFIAGPSDIISNGVNGIIVKDNDIKGLSEAIDYLIDNQILRNEIGKNALEIRSRLSQNKITKSTIEFIKIGI